MRLLDPCSRPDRAPAQGALRRFKSKWGDGFTRNYAALWARLLQLQGQGNPVPSVVVVGKGERRHLMLPPQLESKVAFHPWLRYPVSTTAATWAQGLGSPGLPGYGSGEVRAGCKAALT